jgi:hypothetical protein
LPCCSCSREVVIKAVAVATVWQIVCVVVTTSSCCLPAGDAVVARSLRNVFVRLIVVSSLAEPHALVGPQRLHTELPQQLSCVAAYNQVHRLCLHSSSSSSSTDSNYVSEIARVLQRQ